MQLVNPAAVSLGRLLARIELLDRRIVLAGLIVLSWITTVALALHTIQHNGWLYYTGGDGTYYWTTSWSLAHRILPAAIISYGVPVLLWPLALIAGPSLLAALPVIVILQVAVLVPLVVIGVYAIADRLGGRLFALAATVMWILSPVVCLHFFYPRRRDDFATFALPGPLGLTNLGDFPSLVLTVVVAWLVLRSLDERRWNDVVLAGLLCGFLLAVKPSNGYFVPAPLAAFLVARRWREAVAFAAALVPALVILTIWKAVGLGNVPIFDASAQHVAAGTSYIDTVHTRYLPFKWSNFTTNLDQLREYGWSLRLAEWIPVAGLVGALRRGIPHGVLLGLWFAGYMILKGGTPSASVYEWSYFRLTMPGFPAYVLLAACIVFLIPGLGRRWRSTAAAAVPLRFSRALALAGVVLVIYPLVLIVSTRAHAGNRVAYETSANLLTPVVSSLGLQVGADGGKTHLQWRQPDVGSTDVWYVVYRGEDDGCDPGKTRYCEFAMPLAAVVHRTSWTTSKPGPGVWRVGVIADPRATPHDGDLLLLSTPARAS